MKQHTALKPKGFVIVTGDSGIIEQDTLQCCHCGMHWAIQPGSGKIRGTCMKCNGPVCGPKCSGKCVPMEQRLENMEQGMPVDFVPTRSGVILNL